MATVEIDDEALDKIFIEEMLTTVSYLLKDIERVKESNKGYVYSKDPKVDLLKINALIDAYALILEHYGVTLERT